MSKAGSGWARHGGTARREGVQHGTARRTLTLPYVARSNAGGKYQCEPPLGCGVLPGTGVFTVALKQLGATVRGVPSSFSIQRHDFPRHGL